MSKPLEADIIALLTDYYGSEGYIIPTSLIDKWVVLINRKETEARIDELKNLLKKEELVKYVYGSTYDDEYAVLSSIVEDRIQELQKEEK